MSIQSDQGDLPTENNDDHHGADGTKRMTLCSNGADGIVGRRSNHPPASRAQVHENPGQAPGTDMKVQEVMTARVLPILVALGFLIAGSTLGAQNQPLPNQESFLIETRKHLQTDSTLQSSYVYVETRRELKLDKGGRTREESVKVFESYPGLPGEERWERLIAEDGRPVPPEELARQDRERQQKANEMVQRLARNSSKELARQERELQKARRERDEAVSDIYNVFEIRMIGRERVEEHDTIAFLLTPRRDAKPKTRAGEQIRHFSVRAWVSENDHELVKLEAEAIDDLKSGLGVLARLHKGARLSFLRRKVNGEVWLPAVVSYNGSARVGLLVMLRRSGTSEFSGYRKYSVDTFEGFSRPK